ncbi:GNAT family N-acetyltransferase [Massilia niabensis]|uniref:GNAT family N-acetyltransferase n=1 Tax=Massilia niabensis TaxID=544910 RepID=A0ABW0L8Y9_9BURK
MMRFAPIAFDDTALGGYSALFAACFPDSGKFTRDYLAWLYVRNPDGRAFGFDAWEGDVLAAHYVCIPAQASIGGQVVRVLLSLNTATHPRFQGQGLFTKLAAMTYDAAAAAGYAGVYGVANANSTPGFVRKLGFQLVRPLEALVGVGGMGASARAAGLAPAFERVWSQAALEWRCASPSNAVLRRRQGAAWQFHAPAFGRLIHAYAELSLPPTVELAPTGAPATPLRLYLGLMPDAERRVRSYVDIPKRLRPSPLNLIYRSLSVPGVQLDPAHIRFSFLDFDAY